MKFRTQVVLKERQGAILRNKSRILITKRFYFTSSSLSNPSLSTNGEWSWNLLWNARVMDDCKKTIPQIEDWNVNCAQQLIASHSINFTFTSRLLINVVILWTSISFYLFFSVPRCCRVQSVSSFVSVPISAWQASSHAPSRYIGQQKTRVIFRIKRQI